MMNATATISYSKQLNPWRFFALALGLSWLFWLPAVLFDQNAMSFPMILLLIAGGVGPAIAEIILIARDHDQAQCSDYWQRVLDFRRTSAGWYTVILLTFPVLNGIAIMLNLLLTGEHPDFETARRLLSQP